LRHGSHLLSIFTSLYFKIQKENKECNSKTRSIDKGHSALKTVTFGAHFELHSIFIEHLQHIQNFKRFHLSAPILASFLAKFGSPFFLSRVVIKSYNHLISSRFLFSEAYRSLSI